MADHKNWLFLDYDGHIFVFQDTEIQLVIRKHTEVARVMRKGYSGTLTVDLFLNSLESDLVRKYSIRLLKG